MGALALFLVIAGGTAYAADTIGSSDIINESIQSVDLENNEVKAVDIANNQVLGADVRDGTLTGADMGCPSGMTPVSGDLCYDTANRGAAADFPTALTRCSNAGFRLPTLGRGFRGGRRLGGADLV